MAKHVIEDKPQNPERNLENRRHDMLLVEREHSAASLQPRTENQGAATMNTAYWLLSSHS